MAEELVQVQHAALQAQQEILDNGEELRVAMRESARGNARAHARTHAPSDSQACVCSPSGLRSMFSELSSVSREQQVALSELFNRVSFLQSFLLVETHSLSSCLYNGAALCASYLLTSTRRSSRAR